MAEKIIKGVLQFILILAVQVLILNNVNLFGFAQPMLYIWFILFMPYNSPKWLLLTVSFLLGFCVDVFSAQVGFHTAVSVFTAFIRPVFTRAFAPNQDTNSGNNPSAADMGLVKFLVYVSIMTLIHVFLLIVAETFRVDELADMFIRIGLSSVVTIVLILVCDAVFFRVKRV
ncbi:MAG TPA: hypothetical protein IAC47_01540 [Candidatus Onthomorpha intestinigallinarum]|uniref:Rod shape-determining protein MreD n=1 Tax=Candidatus Onthomorpha intestinigallinarum TaxID=2840880 RepID=A0A9D1RET9_9BACT|nr:hypothetical protein [Candidatus Onthomorpha intestinigallinarum]